MKFIVIEIQRFEGGEVSSPVWAYDSQQEAEAKFHSVLAAAAVSKLPVHSCALFTEEGFPMRHECYKHETEPVPEAVPEIEPESDPEEAPEPEQEPEPDAVKEA